MLLPEATGTIFRFLSSIFQVLALSVERAVNQVVEVVEAEVEQRVLEVVLKTLHEVLLLLAVIRNIGKGVASKLQKAITILRDRHSPLN